MELFRIPEFELRCGGIYRGEGGRGAKSHGRGKKEKGDRSGQERGISENIMGYKKRSYFSEIQGFLARERKLGRSGKLNKSRKEKHVHALKNELACSDFLIITTNR